MVAISTIVAPIIAGTLTIREYFTAYERVMPPITHAEIVEPRRERPGIVEKALEESGNQCIFRLQIFSAFFLPPEAYLPPQAESPSDTDQRQVPADSRRVSVTRL